MDRTRTRPPPWSWGEARVLCLRETSRLLRDREDAEDAAQEAVLRAWKSTRKSTEVNSKDAWLRTIAGNEARRAWGRQDRSEPASDWLEGDSPAVVAADEDHLGSLACEQILAALPKQDRHFVRQRYVDDLSYAEIARAAGVPEATVKTRIHRSLRRLRTVLSSEAMG